ncbi:MAG: DUF2461 domain-containing protein [Chitinophagaceae bacterium]|nr:MAG: DUF2461 domain-containing protein [Chitinophagaceae bacterium]
MLEPQTLRFLTALKKNNNKPWFDANRAQYEAARIDFSNFIQLVIDGLQKSDTTITGLTARDCLFRINRDIRFSKDKTPYKANFGASIKRGGRKSGFAGYYFHLEPGQTFAGGGLWMPEAPALKAVRQEIDYNWDEFRDILEEKSFQKIYGDLYKSTEVSLSTMPKGYEKDHPAATYLRLKSFIAEVRISDEELTRGSLHKKTLAAFEAIQPLLNFINRTMGETGE